MKKKSLLLSMSVFVSLSLLVTACSSSAKKTNQDSQTKKVEDSQKYKNVELTVAAASDLTLAFKEIGENFQKSTGCKVTITYGSTGTTAQQIENGAPYDVFASADEKVLDDLIKKNKVISDTKQLYAIGRVGLATSKKSSLQVKELNDLLKPEIKKIAIANPDHAPYGLAAKQALQSAGLWDEVKDKMVYGKNIQDTLTLITTGNADAGFIALSIYKKDEVNFQLVDDKLHQPLKQAMGVIKGTKNEELARKFISYVDGEEGRPIMKKYGFVLPSETK